MIKTTSPIKWVPSLYFAMGLPFIVIAQTTSLMYKDLEISDSAIAFWTSVMMLPYTLKPVWSPLMELYKTKKFFIVVTQIAIGFTFMLCAFSLPTDYYFQFSIACLGIIALFGATHDIAADGYYIDALDLKRQANYVGWQGAAYNVAKIVAGGLLVYVAGELQKIADIKSSWMIILCVYGVVMLLFGIYHLIVLHSNTTLNTTISTKNAWKAFYDVLLTFFRKKNILWYIVFIILYRFAEGFAIKIAPLFLLSGIDEGGLGLTTSQVGIIYGTFGAAAFVIGSILGGKYIAKMGLKRALFTLACVFNMPFTVYAFLAFFQPQNQYLIIGSIFLEYFGYGFGFVGLMLFMMQQVAPGKYKMAHYAFATGIMNLGFLLPSMMSGFVSDFLGYKLFFVWVMIATIPALLVSYFVPFKTNKNE